MLITFEVHVGFYEKLRTQGIEMSELSLIIAILIVLICIYYEFRLLYSSVLLGVYLLLVTFTVDLSHWALFCVWVIYLVIVLPININGVRQSLISDRFFNIFKAFIPKISETERTALETGDTWYEADLFRGEPCWNKLKNIEIHPLTEAEQSFLDNETETLCSMVDEWQVHQEKDLPENVWSYIRDNGFFGLVIKQEYGGKGFSAKAHSDIVLKIAARSPVAAVTVMVPNSLGPGELLHYYGTQAQKDRYLPGLSSGKEIPCFALTELNAGSDATSIESKALVCRDTYKGEEAVLGLRLSFSKRYITLAPVATLIGLAVNVIDPEGLLGEVGRPGITCVLISRDTEGLIIGNRHYPTVMPFMNGTVRGENIFVPMDHIIGGQERAGEGWKMLVECLSIGRSISLPALGTASITMSHLTTGAYSKLRRQFGLSIGQFEGVSEKLAKILGLSYIIHGTRKLTLAAVDEHKKPSVASAIAKLHCTEFARSGLLDSMDVHAGKAVISGPSNYLLGQYLGAPVSITVEGANIMTRNLLVFGQGAIACHPYILDEFNILNSEHPEEGGIKAKFDQILWKHVGYSARTKVRALWSGLTYGYGLLGLSNGISRQWQQLKAMSYAFSYVSNLALITLGGAFKRKENLSARLGDVLSNIYMTSAVLKAYHENGEKTDELVYVQWATAYLLHDAQEKMIAFCHNYPMRWLGWIMQRMIFPFGRFYSAPSDKLSAKLAKMSMENHDFRNLIKKSVCQFDSSANLESMHALDHIEATFQKALSLAPLSDRVMKLKKEQGLKGSLDEVLAQLLVRNDVTESEVKQLLELDVLTAEVMAVDEFEKL